MKNDVSGEFIQQAHYVVISTTSGRWACCKLIKNIHWNCRTRNLVVTKFVTLGLSKLFTVFRSRLPLTKVPLSLP